ncbi:2,3-bisphosphoglycerate-independent phosphoglycerate mutase [Candidatus Azambacteria bacterium]|nr:2,3-bisphosphoglycerate-independent phosphoglycerate mutase [Candidatus Azambacteria bacterium]
MKKNKVILVICDGMGYRQEKEHNAMTAARTPNLDNFYANFPFAVLGASGEDIGLPDGQMGTSEANHLVIGAGRIIYQNLVKINKSMQNGEISKNPAILEAFEHVKRHNSVLHIKGIASTGGVHGHIEHIKALIKAAKQAGVKDIMLHLFTDGRDTAPKSAKIFIEDLENFLKAENIGKIASIGGRYFGMDRDNNDDRTARHFEIMTTNENGSFESALEAIEHSYRKGISDEFIEPAKIKDAGCVSANDAVIFANFRSDRAKQLAHKFKNSKIENLKYVAMTKYDDELDVRVAFEPEEIKNTLSEVISQNGLRQLKVTETEKFTHLTFFFNAQRYEPEKGEDRILIESSKDVRTHDEKPEMKAKEIVKKIKEAMESEKYDFIATNLVNCDMVGHSGNVPAIIKAVESVDDALGRIAELSKKHGYDLLITADHGNAEENFDTVSGQPLTSHTLNPVPLILISERYKKLNKNTGFLDGVAPTILDLFGLKKPKEMTGESFI